MKIMFITPHLSTGGAPQYLLKKIQELKDVCEIYCIEYSNVTGGVLVVQRNQIDELLGDKLITLSDNKEELLNYIHSINPDVIHFEELPEYFCDQEVAKKIYTKDRKYKIIETSHDSSFNVEDKIFFPDKFAFVSEYQKQLFSSLDIPAEIVEYPIIYKTKTDRVKSLESLGLDPNKTHFLNVGLFTSRKNQAEIVEYAKRLINENVQFHFVGNQADNFKSYWEPIMKNFPSNCKWWGERKDVDTFYNAMDVFLFTSKGTNTDKETNPLVVREAIGWNIPTLMYNLPVYCGMYDKYKNITWLSDNFENNLELITSEIINTNDKSIQNVNINFEDLFDISFTGTENKLNLNYKKQERIFLKVSVKDIDSNMPIYFFNSIFENYVNWWIMPVSKQTFDFENETNFRGFKIEMYDKNDKLVTFKNFFIKNVPRLRDLYIDLLNPFDCLFCNYTEMFVEKKYDCYNIDDLDLVIDIGANAGLFTKLCLTKNVKKIFSIEPNKNCLINLKHITKNENVTVINKAVSNQNNIARFYYSDNNSTLSSLNKSHLQNEFSDIQEYDVECITVKNLIDDYDIQKISMLKMDVEGAEYSIVKSLNKEEYDKIESFLIEFHDNKNGEVRELIKLLENNEYVIDQIRRQYSRTNDDIRDTYDNEVNGTIYAIKSTLIDKKLPKIKAVHLQTTLNDEREQKSRNSLALLKNIGIDVVLHTNELYTSLPPIHNCQRPNSVSIKKMTDDSLTPAHYGCYESFRLGILSEFDDDLDFLMMCEGDCLIEVSSKEFKNTLIKVCEIMDKENIDYFSLGDYDTLQTGIKQSNVSYIPKNQNICYVTERIIGLQCILFSKKLKKRLFNYLRTAKWDAADIYFNNMSWALNIKRAILNKRITTQADGISLIDNEYKTFIKK